MAQSTLEFKNFEDDPVLRDKMLAQMGGEESPELQDPSKDFAANAQKDYMATSQAGMAGQSPEMAVADKAGGALATGGAAAANPYVAGAGLAMQGVAAVDSAKRQQEQAKIDAYNKQIMAERSAIRNLFA